jgi:FAD/FMN-containing dehydrogenase
MTVTGAGLRELRAGIEGQVFAPDHDEYDAARRTFNGMIDRRPRAIVRPAGAADVAHAVRWAAIADVPIAVRGGGHSVAGHAVADDALMIDLSQRRAVVVDALARRAVAEGGCQWLDVDAATQAHGLAVPGGTFGDTGIAGLTLGGGIGYLMGSYGLTCDNLVGAELITADGHARWVDDATDPELLWALRGGGGNFGVVTRFEYQLHPVGRLFGGGLYYPISRTAEVLRLVRDLEDEAPDELVSLIYLGSHGAFGEPVVEVVVAFPGNIEAGERATRPLRDATPLLRDGSGSISYLELQATNVQVPFGVRHYWKGHFVREFSDDVIELAAAAMGTHEGPVGGVLIEILHGAARRNPAETAAFGQRSAAANVSAIGAWLDPADDGRQIAWVRELADSLLPHSLSGAGYVNYATPDEPPDRVRAAFGPDRFARLAAVKGRTDPENRFRFNMNIPPAA